MYKENKGNIELCTTNTKSMVDDENIFGINEKNAIKNIPSAKSNVLNNNPAELSQMETPKNAKVSQTKRMPGSSSFEGNEDKTQEIFEMIKSINESSRKESNEKKIDDFDAFGDIVARKLRSLRTHYAQCTIEHLINNLLYDGELGKYDVPL